MSEQQVPDNPSADNGGWIRDLAQPSAAGSPKCGGYYRSLAPGDKGCSEPSSEHTAADPATGIPAGNVEEAAGVSTGDPDSPVGRLTAERADGVIHRLGQQVGSGRKPPTVQAGRGRFKHAAEIPLGSAEEDFGGADDFWSAEDTRSRHRAPDGISHPDVPIRKVTSPAPSRMRKPMLVLTAAALCALTIGGGTVAAIDKKVSIVVDGSALHVSTMAGSVAGALAAAGISPTGHDAIAPGVDSPISDGSTIIVDRGRLLTLTVDGTPRQVWTTARTVDQALTELGADQALRLSADRSRPIPLGGLAVNASTLHTVELSVGAAPAISTTSGAATVGALLAAQGISVGPRDRISPAPATPLSDGLQVKLARVAVASISVTRTLPEPAPRTVDDPALQKGTSKVVQHGRGGIQVITYEVTTVNGQQTAKRVGGTRTVVAPVATLTLMGTKAAPAVPVTAFTYNGVEVFTNDTSFGVNWDGLAMCESTHNPQAINADPSAGLPTYGLFQFDLPTWESVGGSGNPIDATPQEQLMRAKLLYQQRGLEPWACRDSAH